MLNVNLFKKKLFRLTDYTQCLALQLVQTEQVGRVDERVGGGLGVVGWLHHNDEHIHNAHTN